MKQISFTQDRLAYLIVAIIGLEKRGRWRLVLDRTNWKFGTKHINILYLGVCRDRLAIPLFFTFLRDKKSGNSNQDDRIELMQKFVKTFGKKCMGVLLGDREFIGHRWLKYLIEHQIAFCIRLKDNWQKVVLENGQVMEIKKAFNGLKNGQTRKLGLCQLGEGKRSVSCYITGMKSKKGEWIIVAHSPGLEDPCAIYRHRWQIETMFRAMKTGGFNIEDTHITAPQRLESLFSVVAIAYAICYKAGEFAVTKDPPRPKKHGYWPKSVFRYGLDAITHSIAIIPEYPKLFRQLFTQIFKPIRLTKQSFVL